MALIEKKKAIYPVSNRLLDYLRTYKRIIDIPIEYDDLLRFDNSISLYDRKGEDTMWVTVFYPQSEIAQIYSSLISIYALMRTEGDNKVLDHLFVDRVDLCIYGNTRPFRIRIVNKINDNFDYFYIKKADASRVYGLELEHLLSPNRLTYYVRGNSLIEEHIAGLPGDQFINHYLSDPLLNKTRLAKEFVKFNERCFVRLLGDMHSSNFVIDITPDFEEVVYRIRAIDFDQQCYEGDIKVYLPQYFKQNNAIIQMGISTITSKTTRQYQREERTLIKARIGTAKAKINHLIECMCEDELAPKEHVQRLAEGLSGYYKNPDFKDASSMGELVHLSLVQCYGKDF